METEGQGVVKDMWLQLRRCNTQQFTGAQTKLLTTTSRNEDCESVDGETGDGLWQTNNGIKRGLVFWPGCFICFDK
jgi:hypothetical protein